MGYAFISYSSAEPRKLARVKEFLKEKGIAFWAAPDDIPIGSKYSEVIKRAIAEASCVLFLLSERSQNSTYCKLEVALALQLEKTVIPIQLEDVILNDAFAGYLDGADFYPLPRKHTTAQSNLLLHQLRLLCGDGPVEPVDPSYRLGRLKKGTWLQLLGWAWMVLGLVPFSKLTMLWFMVPPTYDGVNEGLDWRNAPVIAEMALKRGLAVTGLLLPGLLAVCYGFSLNRKVLGKERLYFRQFSLGQAAVIVGCLLCGIGGPVWFLNDVIHLSAHVQAVWVDVCDYAFGAGLLTVLAAALAALIRRFRK